LKRSHANELLGVAPVPLIVHVSFGAGVENVGDFLMIHVM
jgi:hypothetical protein